MPKKIVSILLVCMACHAIFAGHLMAEADSGKAAAVVAPIDWKRFKPRADVGEDYRQSAQLLLNAIRYNFISRWWDDTFQQDSQRQMYVLWPPPKNLGHEQTYRMPASAAYACAVALKLGIFDEKAVEISEKEAISRTVKMIKGLAAAHKANRNGKEGWGVQPDVLVPNDTAGQQKLQVWQSALWAALAGHAGWLLWEDLDAEAKAWWWRWWRPKPIASWPPAMRFRTGPIRTR
jgi:hypothetical protein